MEFLEFQTLVESMLRCIEAVLARGGPTPYLRRFMLVFPLFWQLPVYRLACPVILPNYH